MKCPDGKAHPGSGDQGSRQGKGREVDIQAGGPALAVGGPNLEGRNR